MTVAALAEKKLGVGRLPDRKQPALFVVEGTFVTVLAYFRDQDALDEFLRWQPRVYTPPEAA